MTTIWKAFLNGWRRLVVNPGASPQIVTAPLADRWATFHPSYSYETFVAGYTPKPSGSGFSLASAPGPALEATETARSGGTGLLMIDELNRGNASGIFGELVTVLERDKRIDESGARRSTTIPVRLANVDASTTVQTASGPAAVPIPFEMPDHVYLVGSMNSVDRTIAPLDAAVRRRFRVVELGPDLDALADVLDASASPSNPTSSTAEWGRLAVELLRHVNRRIAHLAGPDFQLGHGYLWPLGSLMTADERRLALVTIWTEKIYPQIEETFRTRSDAIAAAIRLAPDSPSDYPYVLVAPKLELEEAGGLPYIEVKGWGTNPAQHDRWFRFLAEIDSASAVGVSAGSTGGLGAVPTSAGIGPDGPAEAANGAPAPADTDPTEDLADQPDDVEHVTGTQAPADEQDLVEEWESDEGEADQTQD